MKRYKTHWFVWCRWSLVISGLFFCSCQCGPVVVCSDQSPCPATQSCVEGACQCANDTFLCEGKCLAVSELFTSTRHCGACARGCPTDFLCQAGQCRCPIGRTACADQCVDLLANVAHCGVCGNACPGGQFCSEGTCVSECSSGSTRCGDACIRTTDNREHCGGCDTRCPAQQICLQGACQCPPGQRQCTDSAQVSQCIDPLTSQAHCGGCNSPCPAGRLCASGRCVAICPASTPATCFGGCIDLTSNAQHCGACGQSCTQGQLCRNGRCECPGNTSLCGDRCVDLRDSAHHCGGCNRPCQSGQLCAEGRCVLSCPAPTPTSCWGGCVDAKTNLTHCGDCGQSCLPGQVCHAGACTCPQQLVVCGGVCVDTKEHRLHCGGCQKSCAAGELCAEGKCVATCPTKTPTACFGACVQTDEDPKHCGACARNCGAGGVCTKGQCACPTGQRQCGESCVDPQIDSAHCGTCYARCAPEQTCEQGLCVSPCPTGARCGDRCCAQGQTCCGGACVESKGDPAHCGGCNKVCGQGLFCCQGVCAGVAVPQPERCDGVDNNCDGQIDEGCPVDVWTVGGPHDDRGRGIAIGASGARYILGEFAVSLKLGGNSANSKGNYDVYVGKVDAQGQVVWSHTFGGSGFDTGLVLAIDAQENVYAAGIFNGQIAIGTTTLTSQGSEDIFLLKFDTNGTLLWAQSFGGTQADSIASLDLDAQGNLLVSGIFRNQMIVGTQTLISKGDRDFFVAKFDGAGKPLWAFAGGGAGFDGAGSAVFSPQGGVYFLGFFEGTLAISGLPTLTASQKNMFLLALSAQGQPAWIMQGQSSVSANGGTMAKTPSGTLYLLGTFQQDLSFGGASIKLPAQSTPQTYIIRIDNPTSPQAKPAWMAYTLGTKPVYGISAVAAPKGGVFVGGYFGGVMQLGKYSFAVKGIQDGFVAKLDAQGQWTWAFAMGNFTAINAKDDDIVGEVALDTQGNLLATGGYNPTLDIWLKPKGLQQFSNMGLQRDSFMIKFDTSLLP